MGVPCVVQHFRVYDLHFLDLLVSWESFPGAVLLWGAPPPQILFSRKFKKKQKKTCAEALVFYRALGDMLYMFWICWFPGKAFLGQSYSGGLPHHRFCFPG